MQYSCIKNITYATVLTMCCLACRKFVEIDAPKGQVTTDIVFSSDATASAAMLSVYGEMLNSQAGPFNLALYTGYSGDELINYSPVGTVEIYQNAILSNNGLLAPLWNNAYNFIYRANAVYEGCNTSTKLSPEVKKCLMAEALFVRAYWHFYLYNLYGDIPIVTASDYKVNASITRSGKEAVYTQIIKDLEAAENDLTEHYVDAGSTALSEERIRPNTYAAAALLARVYLYHGDFAEAVEKATKVIDNISMYQLTGLNDVFLKNSREAIWQLKPTLPTAFNTPEGNYFILEDAPQNTGRASVSASQMAAFEEGDRRKQEWIGVYVHESATPDEIYYFPYKFKIRMNSDLLEYSMILRLAEMYLVRAEAKNAQLDVDGAVADINTLRDRARAPLSAEVPNPLPALNNTLTREQVDEAILHERRAELFTEQGHRWLDLKRTGKVDEVMNVITPQKGGGDWNNDKQLWPIPQNELLNNPNLVQNKGYN